MLHLPYPFYLRKGYTSISGAPEKVVARALPWVAKTGMHHHFPLTLENPLVVTLTTYEAFPIGNEVIASISGCQHFDNQPDAYKNSCHL